MASQHIAQRYISRNERDRACGEKQTVDSALCDANGPLVRFEILAQTFDIATQVPDCVVVPEQGLSSLTWEGGFGDV